MGTLGYIAKLDGSRELFALNKQYHWGGDALRVLGYLDAPTRLTDHWDSPAALTRAIDEDFAELASHITHHTDWHSRIAQRLWRWAGDSSLAFITEYDLDEFHPMAYEAHKALITGSAYDSDYEDDGVTYKAGSAW